VFSVIFINIPTPQNFDIKDQDNFIAKARMPAAAGILVSKIKAKTNLGQGDR
jgi:hypothetical protein